MDVIGVVIVVLAAYWFVTRPKKYSKMARGVKRHWEKRD